MKKDQLKVTRWLEPAHQNEDKTWTYVWIMDPIIPNTDYDIPTFLNMEYGEEKGKEHWAKYQTFWAKPVEAHMLKQTSFWQRQKNFNNKADEAVRADVKDIKNWNRTAGATNKTIKTKNPPQPGKAKENM